MPPQKDWLDYVNAVVLLLTFGALFWYTIETRCLRRVAQGQLKPTIRLIRESHRQNKTAQDQLEISNKLITEAQRQNNAALEQYKISANQLTIAQQQNEASIMPVLVIFYTEGRLVLRNVGNGPAFHVAIKAHSGLKEDWNSFARITFWSQSKKKCWGLA
jgi:hypothetical protein